MLDRSIFSPDPVTPAWFAETMYRLGPFLADNSNSPPIAIAVSGGGDSLCLAWLARTWRVNILAFVVNHGIRPESTQEASWTIERLRKMNIPSRLLTLTNLSRGPGLAARARHARYAILTDACRETGCVDLLLGHQADDQAETAYMRVISRSGSNGLAAMSSISIMSGIRLIRPLLNVSRQALRNTLKNAGLTWIDDPSNKNRHAQRVRIRYTLRKLGLRNYYWQLAMDAGDLRTRSTTTTATTLAQKISLLPFGWVRLGEELPEPHLLTSLLRSISGSAYPPSPNAVARLYTSQHESTLCGVRLLRWQKNWYLIREQAAIAHPTPARAGVIWDNRFKLFLHSLSVNVQGLSIAACGFGLPRHVRKGWPAIFCATLPALWYNNQRVAVPHLNIADPEWKNFSFLFHPPVPVTGESLYVCSQATK